jgi:hypothetical protein
MIYVALACRFLVGLVFAASAFGKLRSAAAFRDFASWVSGLPVLPSRGRQAVAWAIVVAEVAVAALVAAPWTVSEGLVLGAVVLAGFAAGARGVIRADVRAPCQCFGTSAAPLGGRHVVRNLVLCVSAVVGAVFAGTGGARPAGVALSLSGALAAAMVVVFLDDLAALLAGAFGRDLAGG